MHLANRLFIFIVVLIGLSGCSNSISQQNIHTTQPPNAHEILELNPDADIFQWANRIYLTNIDWLEELTLTKDTQIGEITKNATDPDDFTDGTANKLPVGAIIFSVKEEGGYLLIQVDGQLKKYTPAVEG